MAISHQQIQIKGFGQNSFAISGTAAQSPPQDPGIYDVWADVDCFIKTGTTANNVTTATGYILFAGNVVPVRLETGDRIGAITGAATGTLRFHRVG